MHNQALKSHKASVTFVQSLFTLVIMTILHRPNCQFHDPASSQDIQDLSFETQLKARLPRNLQVLSADLQLTHRHLTLTTNPQTHLTATSTIMCFGSQEYFISCRHPGNFHVTDRCRHRSRCQARVEEQTIHVPGFCPQCQHSAYTDQPRGYIERPRTGGTRWRNYNEMADHYGRKIADAERRVERAQWAYEASGRARRQGLELRHAQQEQMDAQRGWERDEADYRAEEIRSEDEASYAGW